MVQANGMYHGESLKSDFFRITPAVRNLLLINCAVFLANIPMEGELCRANWFGLTWHGMWEWGGLGLLRLLTYQFTHSYEDPSHILWNMMGLFFFGTMLEYRIGSKGVYLVYLLGGVAGAALFQMVAWPQGMQNIPLVGASGSDYALFFFAAAMSPHSQVFFNFVIPLKMYVCAAILAFLGLYSMYLDFQAFEAVGVGLQSSQVAHAAHLGGAVFGLAAQKLGWFNEWVGLQDGDGLLASLRTRWGNFVSERKAADAEKVQQRLDHLLTKVHEKGIGSLSAAERRFLEDASKHRRDR